MPTLEKYKGVAYLWDYIPNLPAAIAFAIIFIFATAAHTWKMVRTRLWFCLPFVVGGVFEVIGFLARIVAHYNTANLGAFITQAVFLLLPPVFFAATLYMVYSRLVRSVDGAQFSRLSPRWTTRLFVCADLACLNIQSAGAGLTPHDGIARIGDIIIIFGLGLQVVVFAVFGWLCWTFHRKFRAHVAREEVVADVPWRQCLYMLYATSLLIQVRNVFRMVEYIMGSDGYLFANEWPTYALDASLMLVVMVGFFFFYPSELKIEKSEEAMDLYSDVTSSRQLVSRPDVS